MGRDGGETPQFPCPPVGLLERGASPSLPRRERMLGPSRPARRRDRGDGPCLYLSLQATLSAEEVTGRTRAPAPAESPSPEPVEAQGMGRVRARRGPGAPGSTSHPRRGSGQEDHGHAGRRPGRYNTARLRREGSSTEDGDFAPSGFPPTAPLRRPRLA